MTDKPSIDKKDIYNGLLDLFRQHRRWVFFPERATTALALGVCCAELVGEDHE
jgi:hypothetical protein